ncbi:heterokaryon incompatibility protein-domain-containing protein [Podospora aff. communis PSN243]|uniref:Heterokaryon incompatibility protein-domain-containing protein n=1 Tax=Podospora aff. communis PSN243 TaxID=3040156 RepID=A0AAV9GCI9_9PEZI|nr:heterokaryon incompatibility protein-domain-containing protein [Podospora aff. communis PSN243]
MASAVEPPIGTHTADYHEVYRNLRLAEDRKETRILQISPGGYRDDVVVKMLVISLEHDKPDFKALSYAWDDPRCQTPPGTIKISGLRFPVPGTVLGALQQIRWFFCHSKPLNLWVDSICINQKSINEKNHQVSLMTHIYSGSSGTIIWLGDCDGETGLIFPYLRGLYARRLEAGETKLEDDGSNPLDLTQEEHVYQYHSAERPSEENSQHLHDDDLEDASSDSTSIAGPNNGRPDDSTTGRMEADESHDVEKSTYGNLNDPQVFFDSVRDVLEKAIKIYESPWFRRTWILQEAALPEKVPEVLYGNNLTTLTTLVRAGEAIGGGWGQQLMLLAQKRSNSAELEPLYTKLHQATRHVATVSNMRIAFEVDRDHGGVEIQYLLQESRTSLTTNDVDKVYGLLGLANEWCRNFIKVDYQKSVLEVYMDATMCAIESQGGLQILSTVDPFRQGGNLPSNWPTWLPRLSEDVCTGTGVIKRRSLVEAICHRASGYHATGRWPPAIVRVPDQPRLFMWGLEIDSIQRTTDYERIIPQDSYEIEDKLVVKLEHIVNLFYSHVHSLTVDSNTSDNSGVPHPDATYAPRLGRDQSAAVDATKQDKAVRLAIRPLREAIWRCLIGDVACGMQKEYTACDIFGHKSDDFHAPELHGLVLRDWLRRVLPSHHHDFWSFGDDMDEYDCLLTDSEQSEQQQHDGCVPKIRQPPGQRVTEQSPPRDYRAELLEQFSDVWADRKAFITKNGWIGFGPRSMEPGDVVALLIGADAPFVLRPLPPKPRNFLMVGECYTQGLMFAEMFGHKCGNAEKEVRNMSSDDEHVLHVETDAYRGALDGFMMD